MLKKLLVINWKWPKKMEGSYLVGVDSEDDAKIFISKHNYANVQNLIEELNGIEAEEKIVLLHKNKYNNFDEETKVSIQKKCIDAKTYFFGGGNDPVYFNKNENTGLLDQTSCFQKGDIGEEIKYSVLDDDNKIKKKYFDHVWNYYSNLSLESIKIQTINLFLPLVLNQINLKHPNRIKSKDQSQTSSKSEFDISKIKSEWEKIKNDFASYSINIEDPFQSEIIDISNSSEIKYNTASKLSKWLKKTLKNIEANKYIPGNNKKTCQEDNILSSPKN